MKDVSVVEDIAEENKFGKLQIIYFYTQNNELCSYMEEVLSELEKQYSEKALFYKVNVKESGGVTINYLIQVAPTILLLKNGVEMTRLTSNDLDSLDQLEQSIEDNLVSIEERLGRLVNKCPIMIFIKGTPTAPKCGFTRQLIALLKELEVAYDYFDILSDEVVRQELKAFSNWPTYPQVYLKGELLGGLDILMEMIQSRQIYDVLATI